MFWAVASEWFFVITQANFEKKTDTRDKAKAIQKRVFFNFLTLASGKPLMTK